jgi:tRNA A-37 threonylcarbamoyl transferase component Bud32
VSLCPSCNSDAGEVAKFCPSCGAAIVRGPVGEEIVGRTVAGKYRVEALIGEGGMGKVFRATQLSLEKTVVLKVLRASLLSDERTVARFQREAKAASRLNHPNSIGIIDFGQGEDGSLYIAMEHVAGRDLHQLLSHEGPLDEPRMAHIIGQVLSALADAHAAGVIHRDLKPENIMVEPRRGDPDFVKVLDFGIAKIQEADGSERTALTRAGFVCGTPEYMSPEQARGALLDPRSDLYAVGVVLYQCATGSLPFEADSAIALATMHLTQEPMPPRLKRPDLSEAMEQLILRAMSKNPVDRPQTAEEFRAELLQVVGVPADAGLPAVGRAPIPLKLTERSSRPLQRRAAGGSASAGAGASPPAPGGEAQQASAPAAPRASRRALGLALSLTLGSAALAGGGLAAYQLLGRSEPGPASQSSRGSARDSRQPADQGAAAQTPSPPTAAQTPSPPTAAPRQGDPAQPPMATRKPARARELLSQGDAAIASGRIDDAMGLYSRAFEADAGSGAAAKRLALAHLMKSNEVESERWMRTYLSLGSAADAEYFERHLRRAR